MIETSSSDRRVRTGLDNLLNNLREGTAAEIGNLPEICHLIRQGANCGLVSNPASITEDLSSAEMALLRAGVRLGAIFGPEHGARGSAEAGEAVGSATDPTTGAPVYSLYGSTVRPTPEMLAGLDLMLFDLQDVGVRFYTYTWTLSHLLEACGEAGIPVVILDRPNPIGGEMVEGPLLEPGLESFVGRYAIPVRHGLTIGELARMFAGRYAPGPPPLISPMTGWRRVDWWCETRLDWAAPSPNIPTPETTWIYPGTCLLEGTNLSEGRGAPLPFRVCGAPWIEPDRLAARLNELGGSRWRGLYFTPSSSKHSGITCGGVEWYRPHASDWRKEFHPVRTGLELIQAVKELWPGEFRWLSGGAGRSHFDRLIGRSDVRARLDAGESAASIAAGWSEDEARFLNDRKPYLLYS
ncbi:MAG TPA: DUF1343 domain-containing protein [Armatimonadota bacterium]|nr:DUF1343 domain-containing protein [Armatimonadota bacterium]